jgi:hypothetical protein
MLKLKNAVRLALYVRVDLKATTPPGDALLTTNQPRFHRRPVMTSGIILANCSRQG